MGLKQLKNEDRLRFLQKFTAALLAGAARKHLEREGIEAEKIKQRFIEKPKELDASKVFESKILKAEPKEKMPAKPQPVTSEKLLPPKVPPMPPKKPAMPVTKPVAKPTITAIPAKPTQVKPRPGDFGVRQLEVLLKDPSIQSVECPGPKKNLLVKRRGQINITQVALAKDEIIKVIEEFSKKARIPLVGGILKAAVGDLIISAVISDVPGPRFIINKRSPYSLIEQAPVKTPASAKYPIPSKPPIMSPLTKYPMQKSIMQK
jgi:hypothetical protein